MSLLAELRASIRTIGLVVLASLLPFQSAAARDLDAVKKSGVLRHLGLPYAQFVTGDGDGMDVEIVRLFADHLGVRYEYVPTAWETCISDLTGAERKGDLIASGMTVLPWRQRLVDFSAPIFPTQVWLVARADSSLKPIAPSGSLDKDIASVKAVLRNRSLLCKANTCLDPSLYDLAGAGPRIVYFPGSLNEMTPALLKGEAEATLLDVPDALVSLQKWPGQIKVIGPVSGRQVMAAAFRKDTPELRQAFDRFLAALRRSGRLRMIALKYYPFIVDYYADFFPEH